MRSFEFGRKPPETHTTMRKLFCIFDFIENDSMFMVDKEMIAFVSHQHVRIKKLTENLIGIPVWSQMAVGSFDFARTPPNKTSSNCVANKKKKKKKSAIYSPSHKSK